MATTIEAPSGILITRYAGPKPGGRMVQVTLPDGGYVQSGLIDSLTVPS